MFPQYVVTAGVYTATVGAGGVSNTNGGDSGFGQAFVAKGGGAGGSGTGGSCSSTCYGLAGGRGGEGGDDDWLQHAGRDEREHGHCQRGERTGARELPLRAGQRRGRRQRCIEWRIQSGHRWRRGWGRGCRGRGLAHVVWEWGNRGGKLDCIRDHISAGQHVWPGFLHGGVPGLHWRGRGGWRLSFFHGTVLSGWSRRRRYRDPVCSRQSV